MEGHWVMCGMSPGLLTARCVWLIRTMWLLAEKE